MIIHNTKEGEYIEDLELLKKIIDIENIQDLYDFSIQRVRYITEDYKSWNFLKGFDNIIEQIKLSEKSIEFNPKSYDTWYHRYFLINKLSLKDQENIKDKENGLIKILLKFDKRNLHCWNYINKLYNNILDFISKDVTNYSYLHYCKSFNSISCIYTDCYDIGMWFYYLTCKENDLLQNIFYVRKYKEEIEIIFKDIFEGEIYINNNKFNINIPIKYFTIKVMDIKKIVLNNKEYNLVKYVDNQRLKHFKDINELEENRCIYNFIFNLEFSVKDNNKYKKNIWSNYINNLHNDLYDIYIIN